MSLMPTNLYGPGDNFDLETSHVLPAMIRKFHEAKGARQAGLDAVVTLWGHGTSRREFLHVDDLARASLHLLTSAETGLFNVGYGSDLTIRETALAVSGAVGYDGEIVWDAARPDGTPRKLLDSTRIRSSGWKPAIDFHMGIQTTYEWYLNTLAGGKDSLIIAG